jgi:hypothetical protein
LSTYHHQQNLLANLSTPTLISISYHMPPPKNTIQSAKDPAIAAAQHTPEALSPPPRSQQVYLEQHGWREGIYWCRYRCLRLRPGNHRYCVRVSKRERYRELLLGRILGWRGGGKRGCWFLSWCRLRHRICGLG